MGLLVNVFKTSDVDCTNNGISSKVHGLCLVNVDGPFTPSKEYPAALLETHRAGIVRIVPAGRMPNGWIRANGWWMMGGNFANTSDSRFTNAVEKLTGQCFYGAVAIHDRQE